MNPVKNFKQTKSIYPVRNRVSQVSTRKRHGGISNGVKRKHYGLELVLNLYECNPRTIRSKSKIRKFSEKLCSLLKMRKYGKPLIPHFGYGRDHTAGYSLVQLIETSSITAHFSELWNTVYLNIFSCKNFNPKKASKFAKEFFQAKKVKNTLLVRE